jgi:hypothetical protein
MKEMLIEKNFKAKRANKGIWCWVVRWPHLLIYPFTHILFLRSALRALLSAHS